MQQDIFIREKNHKRKLTRIPPMVVVSRKKQMWQRLLPAIVIAAIAIAFCTWQAISLHRFMAERNHLLQTVAAQDAELQDHAAQNAEFLRLTADLPRLREENQTLLAENLELLEQITTVSDANNALSRTVRLAALTGVAKPDQIRTVEAETISRGSLPQGEYLGLWEGTVYTATPEETDSEPNISASGKVVAPGYTIAVDPAYWKLGTKFYIEGIGVVMAEDTGSKVKGRNRFDLLVSDKKFARTLGRFKAKVWKYSE